MLGTKNLEAVLGTGIDNRNHEAVRATIRSAADLGLNILFIHPGSKVPTDMRTAAARNKANREAQATAHDAGRRDWATVKSPAGLALATSDKPTLDRYLKAYIQTYSRWEPRGEDGVTPTGERVNWSKKAEDAGQIVMTEPAAVNIAVEVGSSGVVVIDCDTAAQMARWFEVSGIPPEMSIPPTIITPGHIGEGADAADPSTWAHSHGGHFWFVVPDKYLPVLPRHIGAMTWGGDNGFAVLWDRRYVLVPPSTRPEGKYEYLGHVYDLPDWLAEEIIKAGERRLQHAALYNADNARAENTGLADRVDQWASHVSWASILEPMGWTPAPRADSCGCPVWTAPGVHASPKSATAHDTGCSAGRYTQVNAPLHIWTDNPAEPFDTWVAEHGSTISKLQAVALINFKGNVGKAMDEMGISPDLSVEVGLDPKGMDTDLGIVGDGEFELPTRVQYEFTDGPTDIPGAPELIATRKPYCKACKSYEGLFVADADGILWHALDEADAADTGGHEAEPDMPSAAAIASVQALIDQVAAKTNADPLAVDLSEFGAQPPPQADKASPYADTVDDPDPDVFDSPHTGVPRIAPFSHWRDMPPPEYIIDGLLEHGGLSCIIGAPNIGKSTVALDMACHIATGKSWQGRTTLKTKVLYLPGEGLSGAIQRILAWEHAHGLDLSSLILGNGIIQVAAQNEAWGDVAAYIARQGIALVIFDTFARMSSGLEENSATDVGRAVKRFDKLRELTNSGVCVVHHTAKGAPETARGSSALNGALDSELLVRPATWDTDQLRDAQGRMNGKAIEVWTSKQKNAEQLEQAIPLLVTSYTLPEATRSTALITGPNGSIDPMQGDVVVARPLPEPVVETAIRIRRVLDRLTQQGASRADLLLAVRPDAYARHRKDEAAYWKQRLAEAVDTGLRYQLIETLTGTPSGARYIPSSATPDQARAKAAAEVTDSD